MVAGKVERAPFHLSIFIPVTALPLETYPLERIPIIVKSIHLCEDAFRSNGLCEMTASRSYSSSFRLREFCFVMDVKKI